MKRFCVLPSRGFRWYSVQPQVRGGSNVTQFEGLLGHGLPRSAESRLAGWEPPASNKPPLVYPKLLSPTDLGLVAAKNFSSGETVTRYCGQWMSLGAPSLDLKGWMVRQDRYLMLGEGFGLYGSSDLIAAIDGFGAFINDPCLYNPSVVSKLHAVGGAVYGPYHEFRREALDFIDIYQEEARWANVRFDPYTADIKAESTILAGEELTMSYGPSFWLRHALKPILWSGNVGRALKGMGITRRVAGLRFGNLGQTQNLVLKILLGPLNRVDQIIVHKSFDPNALAGAYVFCKNLLLGIGSTYLPGHFNGKVTVNLSVDTTLSTIDLHDRLVSSCQNSESHERLWSIQDNGLCNAVPSSLLHELSICTAVVTELKAKNKVLQKETFFSRMLEEGVISIRRSAALN